MRNRSSTKYALDASDAQFLLRFVDALLRATIEGEPLEPQMVGFGERAAAAYLAHRARQRRNARRRAQEIAR